MLGLIGGALVGMVVGKKGIKGLTKDLNTLVDKADETGRKIGKQVSAATQQAVKEAEKLVKNIVSAGDNKKEADVKTAINEQIRIAIEQGDLQKAQALIDLLKSLE